MNYRIVKINFHNGDTKFSVEREVAPGAWERFYTAPTLEDARKIKQERIDKEVVSREILE